MPGQETDFFTFFNHLFCKNISEILFWFEFGVGHHVTYYEWKWCNGQVSKGLQFSLEVHAGIFVSFSTLHACQILFGLM